MQGRIAKKGRLAVALPALVAALVAAAILGAAASCTSAGSMPPLLGTPGDTGLGDLSAEAYNPGMCPGSGTVTVAFDGGSGTNSCWSAVGYMGKTTATVTLTGNVMTAKPGLAVGITLLNYETEGGMYCSIGPGAKVALDGPCVAVGASFLSSANTDGDTDEWQAFAGSAPGAPLSTLGSMGPDGGAHGTLTVSSFGTAFGSTVSVAFSPGSTLVVDRPGYPVASISGSVTVAVE
jgi:hypothetical protein